MDEIDVKIIYAFGVLMAVFLTFGGRPSVYKTKGGPYEFRESFQRFKRKPFFYTIHPIKKASLSTFLVTSVMFVGILLKVEMNMIYFPIPIISLFLYILFMRKGVYFYNNRIIIKKMFGEQHIDFHNVRRIELDKYSKVSKNRRNYHIDFYFTLTNGRRIKVSTISDDTRYDVDVLVGECFNHIQATRNISVPITEGDSTERRMGTKVIGLFLFFSGIQVVFWLISLFN